MVRFDTAQCMQVGLFSTFENVRIPTKETTKK